MEPRRKYKDSIVEPLNEVVKKALVEMLFSFSTIAADATNPIKEIAKKFMKEMMWRWTADCLVDGKIWVDRIKTVTKYVPSTQAAIRKMAVSVEPTKEVTHEHVVPSGFLVAHIIGSKLNRLQIMDLMQNYCKAVIVTKDEDGLLRAAGLNSVMPKGWKFGDDCYERYKQTWTKNRSSTLYDCIIFPDLIQSTFLPRVPQQN